jgi:hypothetical protein
MNKEMELKIRMDIVTLLCQSLKTDRRIAAIESELKKVCYASPASNVMPRVCDTCELVETCKLRAGNELRKANWRLRGTARIE